MARPRKINAKPKPELRAARSAEAQAKREYDAARLGTRAAATAGDPEAWLGVRMVCAHLNIVPMTLWRWTEKLGFPPPDARINGRRFWKYRTVIGFQARIAAERGR
jgi:hypothetical protein